MHKDTQEELKRLEAALLAEETQKLELTDNLDDFLEDTAGFSRLQDFQVDTLFFIYQSRKICG